MSAYEPQGSNVVQKQGALIAAALAGDAAAVMQLAQHRAEFDAEARQGSMVAALLLAKLHEAGFGGEKSETAMYAWLMWAGFKPTRDDGPDVRQELVRMRSHYSTTLPESVQDDAFKLFGKIWSPTAIYMDNRPRDGDGNVIREPVDLESLKAEIEKIPGVKWLPE